MHADIAPASYGFRLHMQLIASRKDQETSLRARVFYGRTHDPLDQLFQDHLARDCFRDLDHCGQIQEFGRCQDRARGC